MLAKIFDIDYGRLVKLLLPRVLRKAKLFAYIRALIFPLQLLYNSFLINRKNNLYKLSITPGVYSIERALNDRYDSAMRRFKIVDGLSKTVIYIFRNEENKPLFISDKNENRNVYLYTKTETNEFTVDFIVMVPGTLNYSEPEMRAFIDSYKLAGKQYKIQRQ